MPIERVEYSLKLEAHRDFLNNYPYYKWQNIYSVCNGYKPSIYGYIWRKESKI